MNSANYVINKFSNPTHADVYLKDSWSYSNQTDT